MSMSKYASKEDMFKQLLEEECADGDRILALFPHLQRTEGGRLPVAKLVNAISDLAARCKVAEASQSEADKTAIALLRAWVAGCADEDEPGVKYIPLYAEYPKSL